MHTPTRRRFIEILPLTGVGLLAACSDKSAVATATAPTAPAPAPMAAAGAMPIVNETDPTAVSLGYVSEATRADPVKYKTYTAGSACGNCALYAGKPGAATGPCPLFAGRQVSAKGWCSAHAKKSG